MRKIMKVLIIVMIVFALSVPAIAANPEGDPNFTKVYVTKKGDVLFGHAQHAIVLVDCEKCHSLFPDKKVDKERAHSVCKSCHQAREMSTKCDSCHAK